LIKNEAILQNNTSTELRRAQRQLELTAAVSETMDLQRSPIFLSRHKRCADAGGRQQKNLDNLTVTGSSSRHLAPEHSQLKTLSISRSM
jgi:hypothetical protein